MKLRKYKFIAVLRYLEISEPIDGSFALLPGIDLINDPVLLKKYLDHEFEGMAGVIEFDHYKRSKHLLVCEFDESMIGHPMTSNEALTLWLVWLSALLKDAWLVKDHAIQCEVAYAKMTYGKHSEWSNNTLNAPSTMSSGHKYETIPFNLIELSEWEAKSCHLQTYLHQKESGSFKFFVDKKFSRIGRSLRFVNAARAESELAIKISHYCSALESLFSNDNAELSHKLAERVAVFMKPYGYSPIDTFDSIKSIYGIRSKVTHGDSLRDKELIRLTEHSKKCDEYLRSIINAILGDPHLISLFDGDKASFELYFKEKILINE